MARLRGEGGCPWDREQTYETIKNYLIEETYEVVESIEEKDFNHLAEELGDVLLQIVFLSQIAEEKGHFDIDKVIDSISSKMIRRHPHVFGDKKVSSSDEVLQNWEGMKQTERLEKPHSGDSTERQRPSILDGVTTRAPAVIEASQLSQRAARVGFDWSSPEDILAKLQEEIEELRRAAGSSKETETPRLDEEINQGNIADEIGDIIFVAVNLARHFKIDPESALKRTNNKFRNRFRYIESMLARSNKTFQEVGLEELERYWQEAKSQEAH